MVAFIHGMSITDQEAASNVGAEQRLRFAAPQDPIEVVTLSSTRIASAYHQVRVGGDLAALKGIMKAVFTLDAESLIGEEPGVLDRAFISEHTTGIDSLKADIEATTWDETVSASGLSQAAIESAAEVYAHEKNVIVCYGMGVTQGALGTSNVQQIANLLMLRGKIGRQGAGIAPIRGITESPGKALLKGMERAFGFQPHADKGHNAVAAMEAIIAGESKALICLVGNLPVAMSDHKATFAGMIRLDLAVHIATKLNRPHLLVARTSLILPCLSRTDLDTRASGPPSGHFRRFDVDGARIPRVPEAAWPHGQIRTCDYSWNSEG